MADNQFPAFIDIYGISTVCRKYSHKPTEIVGIKRINHFICLYVIYGLPFIISYHANKLIITQKKPDVILRRPVSSFLHSSLIVPKSEQSLLVKYLGQTLLKWTVIPALERVQAPITVSSWPPIGYST